MCGATFRRAVASWRVAVSEHGDGGKMRGSWYRTGRARGRSFVFDLIGDMGTHPDAPKEGRVWGGGAVGSQAW